MGAVSETEDASATGDAWGAGATSGTGAIPGTGEASGAGADSGAAATSGTAVASRAGVALGAGPPSETGTAWLWARETTGALSVRSSPKPVHTEAIFLNGDTSKSTGILGGPTPKV